MTFDCRKPFATRDGRTTPEVLSVGDDGFVEGVLDGVEFCWNADGRLHVDGNSPADLVNVDPTSPPDTEARSDASDDAAIVEPTSEMAEATNKLTLAARKLILIWEDSPQLPEEMERALSVFESVWLKVDAALARLSARRNPALAWRDIASAPKDGTPLLLRARCKTASAEGILVGWHLDDYGWVELAFRPNGPVGIVPSAWMPLPASPGSTQEPARALPQPAGMEPVAWQWKAGDEARDIPGSAGIPFNWEIAKDEVAARRQAADWKGEVRPLYAAPPAPAQVTSEMVELLRDVCDNGLIYWEPRTTKGHVAKAQMLAKIDAALARSPSAGATGSAEDMRERAAQVWQPIETAPKDGSEILACCMEAQTPKARIAWAEDDKWYSSNKPEKFVVNPHRWWPTHWLPLPLTPPKPDATRAGEGR